jgi:hypothetical protein
MKYFLTIISLFWALTIQAQNTTTLLDSAHAKYFVALENGTKVYTNDLKSDYSYYKGSYLLVDNKDQYDLEKVKYYQGFDGFFQKFPLVNSGETPSWYRREETNRINIYSKAEFIYNPRAPIVVVTPYQMPATTYMNASRLNPKTFYFQIGELSPQKFRAANLINVVGSNPQSLKLVNQANNLSQIRTALVLTGLGMMIAGIAKSASCKKSATDDCTATDNAGGRLFLGGLVAVLIPLTLPKPWRKCREAVYIFNK